MKPTKFLTGLGFTLVALATLPAQAYTTYFGEDLNNSSGLQPGSLTRSLAAQSSFLSKMSGVRTENFEGMASGTNAGTTGLNIAFSGGSSSIGAQLVGSGSVAVNDPGESNLGRYSAPGGSNYWSANLTGGSFSINFSTAISAFGFFGTDIGDFGGIASIDIFNGATLISSLNLPNTVGNSQGSTDGSALYFGFIAQNTNEAFTKITFRTSYAGSDIFGFDSFTVAEASQLISTPTPPTPPNPIPEPTSLALVGLALAAAGFTARRQRQA